MSPSPYGMPITHWAQQLWLNSGKNASFGPATLYTLTRSVNQAYVYFSPSLAESPWLAFLRRPCTCPPFSGPLHLGPNPTLDECWVGAIIGGQYASLSPPAPPILQWPLLRIREHYRPGPRHFPWPGEPGGPFSRNGRRQNRRNQGLDHLPPQTQPRHQPQDLNQWFPPPLFSEGRHRSIPNIRNTEASLNAGGEEGCPGSVLLLPKGCGKQAKERQQPCLC